MVLFSKEYLEKESLMVLESDIGLLMMGKFTKDFGIRVRCMGKEN